MDTELVWKPFSGGRLISTNSHGFTVIRPVEKPEPVPLFCPICDLMMRTNHDTQTWHENNCCSKCSMKWAEPNRDVWMSGWRPALDDVKAEVKLRLAIPIGVKLDGAA